MIPNNTIHGTIWFHTCNRMESMRGRCHSPLPDWIAVEDESATEEAMIAPQNSRKGILDSKLS